MVRLTKRELRIRRHRRVRKRIFGTPERPRLSIYRSNTNIYAQLIDDLNGKTLVSASSLNSSLKEARENKTKVETAREVGFLVGRKAIEKGISEVVFDRGGFLYHGRVKALAEGAREAGLKF